MTQAALAAIAAALVAGGGVVGYVIFRETPDAVGPQSSSEVAALRATLAEQSATIARLEAAPSADLSRLRAAVDEQSARIARLEAKPASPGGADGAARAKKTLDELTAITDGGRTIAVQEALAALVRAGDPAVPEIVAVLESGLEREYGGRFAIEGNAVACYPGLRLVLMDALRQIGTASARDGLVRALEKSDRLADFEVVSLYWRYGVDSTDPALVAAFSALASRLLRQVAAAGLEATADTPNSAVSTLLYWLMEHPSEADAPTLEQLVLRGRPKGNWAPREFESVFRVFVQLAPEKAAQATQTLHLNAWETVDLSGYLRGVARTNQVRYYEVLFGQPGIDARIRGDLYSHMPNLDERIKDPAQRAADAQPIVRFLESRVSAETDAGAKTSAEQALARLREAIAQAQK